MENSKFYQVSSYFILTYYNPGTHKHTYILTPPVYFSLPQKESTPLWLRYCFLDHSEPWCSFLQISWGSWTFLDHLWVFSSYQTWKIFIREFFKYFFSAPHSTPSEIPNTHVFSFPPPQNICTVASFMVQMRTRRHLEGGRLARSPTGREWMAQAHPSTWDPTGWPTPTAVAVHNLPQCLVFL